MFNATLTTNRYQPRPGDADPDVFAVRMKACEGCRFRQSHRCQIADQLCSIIARPSGASCPNRSWPGDEALAAAHVAAPIAAASTDFPGCAVVVICHNYGRYLADAVNSAASQTVRPAEILIVDDSSTDNTAEVAASLGVKYLRLDVRSVTRARFAGLRATTSPIVCFLDADDTLPPDYLESGLPLFKTPNVGIVYSNMQRFGEENRHVEFPPTGFTDIDHQNYAHAGSLIRRAALECSDAFACPGEVTRKNQDDWYLWRRMHAAGWQLAKSPANYGYRRHSQSHCAELVANRSTHYDLASLAHETLTLFVPFAGRRWAWPAMREFLERQTWPHDRTRLVFCDTSDDPLFSQELRNWLARSDYIDARHYWQTVGPAGLADDNRRMDDVRIAVQSAMPRIYNRLAREATTEFIWIVEDDITPPLDAAERLLREFDDNTASVSGVYESRFMRDRWVAWEADCQQMPKSPETETRQIYGNGFGCVILRRSVIRRHVFQNATPTNDYDPNFYHWLTTQSPNGRGPWIARLNCRVECAHNDPPLCLYSPAE